MNKKFIPIILLIMLLLFSSCNFEKGYERSFFAMNTVMSLKAYGEKEKDAVDKAVTKIYDIEKKISRTDEQSEIYKLNNSSGKALQVSEETLSIIKSAVFYGERTNGALDVTIEPIISLWNISGGKTDVPKKEEINNLLKLVNYKNILINNDSITLNSHSRIDLGALGKGYASQVVFDIFKENGIKSGLINLGGNIAVLGKKVDGKLWKVALRDPQKTENDFFGYVETENKFVISSGDYERYFEKDGIRYHHIFDPKSGYPANTDLHSVSVICDNGVMGDALSTALFVMGLNNALDFYKKNKDFEAVFVTKDKRVVKTDGLNGFVFNEGSGYKYEAS